MPSARSEPKQSYSEPIASPSDLATQLAAQITSYLTEHPTAAILEDGRVLFDLRFAKYAIQDAHNRCVLQLWSEERNVVRTVVSLQQRSGCLRLVTRRLGAPKPTALELVPTGDRRTPSARDLSRRRYLRLLERVLERAFPDWQPDGFRAATDLEHSFGPAYARGRLLRGPAAQAVIGISPEESSSTIDGILTLGLLWLDHCREHSIKAGPSPNKSQPKRNTATRHYGGLKVIVPPGTWKTTAERMAWLNPSLASFELYELDPRSEELSRIDIRDSGNVEAHLTHAFDVPTAIERAQPGIAQVMQLISAASHPAIEIRARSAAEVGLLLYGLEFARIRNAASTRSFTNSEEITFGAGANETLLNDESAPLARQLLAKLFTSRQPGSERANQHSDPLFRLQPERWLESRIRHKLDEILPGLRPEFLYTQVPAISAGDRGMLDLLTVDRTGRLIVIEVKADDDMQLPLQGLDYWLRVQALNADRKPQANRETGSFERHGYFRETEINPRPPKLLLIAPALRIHPSNEIVLRYLSPQVEWELVAVGEHWREDLKVVFRKRSQS